MFTKHLVMGCLLLSGIAQISAMEPEMNSDDSLNSSQLGSIESEVGESVRDSGLAISDDVSDEQPDSADMPMMKNMSDDMKTMHKDMMEDMPDDMQAMHKDMMKKKMGPADEEEVSMTIDEVSTPVEISSTEDAKPAMTEDKDDNQKHADVQGVFESMSREEEDESFPG
jgi:hypothetical protein